MIRAILLFLASGAAWAQADVPRYPDAVLKLDAKEVKLQGFMLPLGVGEKQTHFLLAANPSECAFCMSGGPESFVEVKAKTGLKYGLGDPAGSVFYRLHDAVAATK